MVSFFKRNASNPEPDDMVEDHHIPGTDIMRDHDGIHVQRGHGGQGEVLVPVPSTDPRDPLTWTVKWKLIVMVIQWIFTLGTIVPSLSIAPLGPMLAEEWHLGETAVAMLTGIAVLMLGYANFVIVPCSNIFGRRITSIVCSTVAMASLIWAALAKSHASFIGSRVLNGFFTACNESIMVQTIADVFFLHQRGVATGFYFAAYFFGLFLGPIISGTMAQRYGWRSFFWLGMALSALNTVLLITLFPETQYLKARPTPRAPVISDPHGNSDTPSIEKYSATEHIEEIPADAVNPVVGKGSPSKQQFKLWQPINKNWRRTIFKDVISPWAKFFNPIILWTALNVNGAASCLLCWNIAQSMLLSAPPYNFSMSAVGFSNFAFLGGGIIGLATAGPFSDWWAKRLTKRNNGIREAEFRLPALIPYGIAGTIGFVVGGVGFDHKWPWPAIVILCFGSMGLVVTSIPAIAVAYAIDCYTPISGDIMVVATVVKNSTGFGMSYWFPQMAAKRGMVTPAMIQLALLVGPLLLAIPLFIWGKSIRKRTRHSSWHRHYSE